MAEDVVKDVAEDVPVEGAVVDGMEPLPPAECERRLRAGGVGILALPGSLAPRLRPVNFTFHEGQVVVRTGQGQILAAARAGEAASFVVSDIDRFEHTGWSVIVSGTLEERTHLDAEVPLRPWARAEKAHLVALSVESLSGRRIADGAG